MDADPAAIELLAAPDGAPEAWLGGRRAGVSVSLSHRAGRALAAVADLPRVVGCDLELLEPRSSAFVREWLAPAERGLEPNLAWTAKEAAAKVRREGLRLDVRHAVARPATGGSGWQALLVAWEREGLVTHGWWRAEPGWVMALAAAPDAPAPSSLDHSRRSSSDR
jgi:4'-phosphopantetheinyl transferase